MRSDQTIGSPPNTSLQRTTFSFHQFCIRKIGASFSGR